VVTDSQRVANNDLCLAISKIKFWRSTGKPASGWVFPSHDRPAEHVPYSTIDSQHFRVLAKLNAPDAEGNGPQNPITFRLYDLRHTCLTRLGEVNTDPFTIQKIAGHSSITMSQRYVHPTDERLEDAFARLETYNQAKVSATNVEDVSVN
jgi:integrase